MSFDESSLSGSYSYSTGTVTEQSGSTASFQRGRSTSSPSLGETSTDASQTGGLRYFGETDALSNVSGSDFSARVSDGSGLSASSSGDSRERGGTASLSSGQRSREEGGSSSEDASESYVSGLGFRYHT